MKSHIHLLRKSYRKRGKPDSVLGSHSSRGLVTKFLKRFWGCRAKSSFKTSPLASGGVYSFNAFPQRGRATSSTFSSCLAQGEASGLFSVTLSVALQLPVFHWHLFLRSPDFPLPLAPLGKEGRAATASFSEANCYVFTVRRRRRRVPTPVPSIDSLSCQK